MKNESKFDPKIIEEMIKFGKHVMDAPKLVSAPDEISLEITPHDIVQEIDKTRLLHYRPLTEKQHKTPLLISYALINRYHILDIQPEKSWVRNLLLQGFDVYMLDWGSP
ncbi:MAG: class III poly(R)-hydroxyalkanoic acid synthase subunit PhaC, partial [Nitrosarchaeum sp.]